MSNEIKIEKSSGNVFSPFWFVCFSLVNAVDKRLSKFCDKQNKLPNIKTFFMFLLAPQNGLDPFRWGPCQ